MSDHTTCPYCGYHFETEAQLDAHVPCPENKGDKVASARTKAQA